MRQSTRRTGPKLRLVPRLEEQGFVHNPGVGLALVQHWSGFPRDLHAIVTTAFYAKGLRRTNEQQVSKAMAADRFKCSIGHYVTVAEDRAREILQELGHPADETCATPECGERLPIGGRWCVRCGAPYHVPQPDCVLPAGARRIPR